MNLENRRFSNKAKCLSGKVFRVRLISQVSFLLAFASIYASVSAQGRSKKDVLILEEVGLSHSLTDVMTQEIIGGVRSTTGQDVEFFSESLDILSFPGRLTSPDMRDWIAKKYGDRKLDVVVAVGPDTIKIITGGYGSTLFSGVPIVICGSAADQAGNPDLDSRFTGTWQKREPGKTLEVALRLLPNTRHVFVVGGTSVYDRVVMAATKEFFSSLQDPKTEFSYLVDMEMGRLLEQLRNLPQNSIVFYTSFFQDSAGNKFLNATKALPLIAAAANAPVFGMSDTYLGHGIVGGDLMNFREQGKVTARIISELLDGKKAGDIPVENLPSMYMFDWNQLKRWHIPETRLPYGSAILFREPSLWERSKWIWITTLLIVLTLSALAAYLQYSQKQLKLAKEKERHLSGQMIHAEEQERRRIASELHDDFSQRLALLALGLENVEEATPSSFREVHGKLHDLVKSTSEFSADLHTLSHRLHSSTLESLGLVPAIAALCTEFTEKQGIGVAFTANGIPRSVHPDTALCIFRVVQEGLRNLKKHSGAKDACVVLRMERDRLIVIVCDEGYGFDLSGLRRNEGIGVRSMEERTRALGGDLEIRSKPGKGTTLKAWVPIRLTQDL
jgi:signal transduction histidine kinase